MSIENPTEGKFYLNLETPLSDDAGERKKHFEYSDIDKDKKDELTDTDKPKVTAEEMIKKLKERESNE